MLGIHADLLTMTVLRRGLGQRLKMGRLPQLKITSAMRWGFGHGEKTGSGGGGAAPSGPGCNLPLILERSGGSSN